MSPSHAPKYKPDGQIVRVDGNDNILESLEIFAKDSHEGFGKADWEGASDGLLMAGSRNAFRLSRVRNTYGGVATEGDHSVVEYNTIQDFAGDGIDGLGDYQTFQYNVVKNCFQVNDDHNDGFQSWSLGPGGPGTGVSRGSVVRGNLIIGQTDPDRPFRADMQGIGGFDGLFTDWVVENNVVIVNQWHGITFYGAKNLKIVNNTVIGVDNPTAGPPWILVAKGNHVVENVVIRNNITEEGIAMDDGPAGITEDHNLQVSRGTLGKFFVDAAHFDLKLAAGSPAIDTGGAEGAPAIDFAGVARPKGAAVDIGALKWTPNFGPGVKVVRESLLQPKRSRTNEEHPHQAHAGVQGEGRPRRRA